MSGEAIEYRVSPSIVSGELHNRLDGEELVVESAKLASVGNIFPAQPKRTPFLATSPRPYPGILYTAALMFMPAPTEARRRSSPGWKAWPSRSPFRIRSRMVGMVATELLPSQEMVMGITPAGGWPRPQAL